MGANLKEALALRVLQVQDGHLLTCLSLVQAPGPGLLWASSSMQWLLVQRHWACVIREKLVLGDSTYKIRHISQPTTVPKNRDLGVQLTWEWFPACHSLAV